jgi:hypothetical protein
VIIKINIKVVKERRKTVVFLILNKIKILIFKKNNNILKLKKYLLREIINKIWKRVFLINKNN